MNDDEKLKKSLNLSVEQPSPGLNRKIERSFKNMVRKNQTKPIVIDDKI